MKLNLNIDFIIKDGHVLFNYATGFKGIPAEVDQINIDNFIASAIKAGYAESEAEFVYTLQNTIHGSLDSYFKYILHETALIFNQTKTTKLDSLTNLH